jgi:shikimate dehydrogenase
MRRACVIGWPIGHSRSPMIHGHWLREHGIAGEYGKRAVKPEELEDFLLNLAAHGLVGCNVTVPHKEAAFGIVRRANPSGVSALARALGAVNTVWLDERGRLCADNTDVHGFMANFLEHVPGWRASGQHVLIIGAGGAARAVVAAFAREGVARVTIANRTVEKAERLAQELSGIGEAALAAAPLTEVPALLAQADVLVNTTSLGMAGQPPLDIDLAPLPAHAVVADIVYVPLKTALLERAEARGLKTVEGLGMLLHQAVPGFERFFGVRPEVTPELRALVTADILKEQAGRGG